MSLLVLSHVLCLFFVTATLCLVMHACARQGIHLMEFTFIWRMVYHFFVYITTNVAYLTCSLAIHSITTNFVTPAVTAGAIHLPTCDSLPPRLNIPCDINNGKGSDQPHTWLNRNGMEYGRREDNALF